MDKERMVDLTNKVYKQTLLFPKKEPLRVKIREVADDILSKIVKEESNSEIKKDLELIGSYFEIVKWQNWISYFDVIKIKEEYESLGKELEEKKPEIAIEEKKIKKEEEDLEIDPRKRKIMDILKERESVQVKDIKEVLPTISKRTLRRDFDLLIKKGLVQRIGESNNTFYKLN